MTKHLLLYVIILLPLASISQERQSNPRSIQFITEDIPRFWTAYDSNLVNPSHGQDIFSRMYLEKGSPGLQEFNKQSIKGAANLTAAASKYLLYYNSIRSNTYKVDQLKKGIVQSLVRFKRIYKPAKFPPIYFLIGDLNSGGRSSKDGLLIGVEVNCADDYSNFTNIYPPFVPVLKALTISNLPNIVTHELIHYQQAYADVELNLLGNIIREGSADFLSELATGKPRKVPYREYGDIHERNLWLELKDDRKGAETGKWLYNSTIDGRPGNLGYYMGYRIVQSYYQNSRDKKQAVKDILNITDFEDFLNKSKYAEKFN